MRLYERGTHRRCWLLEGASLKAVANAYQPPGYDEPPGSSLAAFAATPTVAALLGDAEPADALLPIVLTLAHDPAAAVAIACALAFSLAACAALYWFLLCREWLCQHDWARKYQHF